MTVFELMVKLMTKLGYKDNPRTEELTVRVYERNNNGDVIKIEEYPISWIRAGDDGATSICVEVDNGYSVSWVDN